MAVDKLVDSTQLDADLTSVANAIRTKGGTSASLAFPAGFVSAIGDIPTGGGGNYDIASGTITPASNSKSIYVDVDFEPTHALIFADFTNWAYTSWQEWGNVIFDTSFPYYMSLQARISNGNFQFNTPNRAISNVSYSGGKFKFADTQYNFQAGTTYTWFAWREKP